MTTTSHPAAEMSCRVQPSLARTPARLEAAGSSTRKSHCRQKAPSAAVRKIVVEFDPCPDRDDRATAQKLFGLVNLTAEFMISQPKQVSAMFDSREILVRLAKRHGVPRRQSYATLGKKALRLASRSAHARQVKRARREIRRLKTDLGRVFRDARRAGRQLVRGRDGA